MAYLIGIDNGGTFSKAAVFDENGKQYASYSIPTKVYTPKPGYMQRNMDELWQSNIEAIYFAIKRSGIDASKIKGVSIAGHGKGLYLVGKSGENIYDGILSTDTRAWKYVEHLYNTKVNVKVYQKTKQEILVSQPVCLLMWLKEHEPDVFIKIGAILSVKDYVRYKLCGEINGEYTDFSGGNLINLNSGAYDKELLALFGLEEVFDMLPPLLHSSDVSGYISAEVAGLTGIPEGTPVAAGMFDVNACGIASGLLNEDKMCMIAGTWSINEFITKEPVTNGTVALNSMFCIPDYYLVEESSPNSAGNMEWFLNSILNKKPTYEEVNEWVSSVKPEESNIIYLPFLNGSSENPLAGGSLIGMQTCHNRKHVFRAIYEGIAFLHYSHIKKLLLNRTKPKSIYLSGGVVNSDIWVQIFADVIGIPIEVIKNKENGALGAAMAAGIAAGVFKNYQSAGEKVVEVTCKVNPDLKHHEIYKKKFRLFCEMSDALNPMWREC